MQRDPPSNLVPEGVIRLAPTSLLEEWKGFWLASLSLMSVPRMPRRTWGQGMTQGGAPQACHPSQLPCPWTVNWL